MQFSIMNSDDIKKHIATRALLIFFIVIIILTFFANTINNFTFPKVIVCQPREGSLLKTVIGEGTVEAIEKTDIYFDGDINVKIEDVPVRSGYKVSKGDELIVLRKDDIDQQTLQDTLLLDKLKFIYSEAQNEYNSGTGVLAYKRAIDAAKENLDESKRKLETESKLYDLGAESQENLRIAQKQKDLAEKTYQNSIADYNVANSKALIEVKKLEYDIKMQEEKANYLKNEVKVGNMICSPFDGIVQDVNVTKGMWINSTVKLCTVEDTKKGYEFKVNVDAQSADFIRLGDKANIRIKSLGSETIDGKVKEINESTQNKGIMKEVIISMSGDKVSGDEKGDVCIEKSTKSYSMIVANNAVLPGNSSRDGFIRILKEKEGFLGKEYYIDIVNVTIIDADNEDTAIYGAISSDDRIVVQCDKPLYDKNHVILDKQIDGQ